MTVPRPPISSPVAETRAADIRTSRLRSGVQIVGFCIGLGLLGWCVFAAAKPENVRSWERLREAPASSVAALLALSLASVLVNGAIFRQAIRPVARLGVLEVQCVNAVATLLAYLPFKLSMLFRVLVHNRRDGLPLLTIAAWFGAIAATLTTGVLPPIAVSAVRKSVDAVWWAMSIGGVVLASVAMVVIARAIHEGTGWTWFVRLWRTLPLPRAIRGNTDDSASARPGLLPRIHEGLRMLASARAVGECVLLRSIDAAIHTSRFLLAAGILGIDLPAGQAVIAGCSYFLIGVAAPSGTVGLREALTGGLLGRLLTGVDPDQFMVAVLMVSAAEAVVLLPAAIAGAAWLKPWRLRRRTRHA